MKIKKYPIRNLLGESLFWDSDFNELIWTDIIGKKIWSFKNHKFNSWLFREKVSWIMPIFESDKILIGFSHSIAIALRSNPVKFEIIKEFSFDDKNSRLNDVCADSTGAIWFGSMSDNPSYNKKNPFFRMDSYFNIKVVDDGYCIANGPVISLDDRTLLHTDSFKREIYSFDVDIKKGEISNKRIWKKFEIEEGIPDGMCFDYLGNLWVAMWGTGQIRNFDKNGILINKIDMPTSNISNVCFGGENMNHLFLTSANLDGEPNEFAGSLFGINFKNIKGVKTKKSKILI
jgi:D-xylonolactonase